MSYAQRIADRIPLVVNEVSEGAKELIIAPAPDIISPATNIPFNTITLAVLICTSILISGIVIWKSINWLIPKFTLNSK